LTSKRKRKKKALLNTTRDESKLGASSFCFCFFHVFKKQTQINKGVKRKLMPRASSFLQPSRSAHFAAFPLWCRRAAAAMMHTRFRCRKLAYEHNHLCCRELPSAETHLIHCRAPYAPVMEHVHLNCRELVIEHICLGCRAGMEHIRLKALDQEHAACVLKA